MAGSELRPQSDGRFPWKPAGTIAIAVGLLTGAHWYGDHSRGWDPATFKQLWAFRMPRRPKPLTPLSPAAMKHPDHVEGKPGQPESISEFMVDDHLSLDPFFEALWRLEQERGTGGGSTDSGPGDDVVTIVHYGDSPTTADLITGDMRDRLQKRFGNAGEGFNLTAKPWAWYGHRHVSMADSGWMSSQKDATGVGRYKRGDYGLGGGIFAGTAGAHTSYTLTGEPQAAVIVHYLVWPGGGSFSVSAGDTELGTVSTDGAVPSVATRKFVLPGGTTRVSLKVVSGTVKHFGVDFRTGHRGILYDSLGLNGATTAILSRTFQPERLAESLHAARPKLIVINYGTNESQFGNLVSTLEKELTMAIANVRAAAPGVPILIMSPMDRGDRQGGEIVTKAEIPRIVAIQKKVAADQGCAFFDTYDAMGGDGTVGGWYAAQPRLMTADLIHPTPQGAAIVATLLQENLYAGYDRWKRAHGIPTGAVPPAPPAPHAKPSAAVQMEAPPTVQSQQPSAMHENPVGNPPPAAPSTTPEAPEREPVSRVSRKVPDSEQDTNPATAAPASSSNPEQAPR